MPTQPLSRAAMLYDMDASLSGTVEECDGSCDEDSEFERPVAEIEGQ